MAQQQHGWRVELNGQIFTAWDIILLITTLQEKSDKSKGPEKVHVEDVKNKLQLATMGDAPRYAKLHM